MDMEHMAAAGPLQEGPPQLTASGAGTQEDSRPPSQGLRQGEIPGTEERRGSIEPQLWRNSLQAVIQTASVKRDELSSAELGRKGMLDRSELGSLLDFLPLEKLQQQELTRSSSGSTCTPQTLSKAASSRTHLEEASIEVVPPPPFEPLPPPYLGPGHRRPVHRGGDRLTTQRAGCPRSVQLRAQLPLLQAANDPSASRPQSARAPKAPPLSARVRPPPGTPAAGPARGAASPQTQSKVTSRSQLPLRSNFAPMLLTATSARPSQERHPLLIAMEERQELDVATRRTGFEAPALLAQQLGENVWDDPRKGFWGAPPQWSRLAGEDEPKATSKKPLQSSADCRSIEDLAQLMRVMDPEGLGALQPELFVVLLFWLGLAKRRAGATAILERAFGAGDIQCTALLPLAEYTEVQVQMVEGLQRLAQLESLEPLCDFISKGDMLKPRRWFQSMKRDPTGSADTNEVLRWFAQSDVMSGNQDLFRFLSHSGCSEESASKPVGPAGPAAGGSRQRSFRLEDFLCLLCRCIMTWCLVKTIELLHAAGPGTAAELRSDHDLLKCWAELQRHISVSFFVNQRFWGVEPRQVVMSVRPLKAATIGSDLSQEQWMTLYQRVRAQGIAAVLPDGEEAEDPDFLSNLARQSTAWVRKRTAPRQRPQLSAV